LNQKPNHENEKKSGLFSWKLLAGLALMAVFLWLAFRKIPLGSFIDTLREVSLLPLAAAAAIVVLSIVLRGWRWKIMLASSQPELKKRYAVMATGVGYAVNLAIPRGGEVARAIFLKRIASTSLVAGLSSVLAERLIDVVSLCVLFVATLSLYQHQLEGVFPGVGRGMFFAGLLAMGGFAVMWVISRNPDRTSGWIGKILYRFWPSQAERISGWEESFSLGLGGVFVRKNAPAMIALTAGIWLLYIAANWTIIFAFPSTRIASLTVLDICAVAVVVAISFSLPSPGGTGTTHFFVSQMLTGIYGIDPAHALAYATLLHLVGTVPALLLGGASAMFMESVKTGEAS